MGTFVNENDLKVTMMAMLKRDGHTHLAAVLESSILFYNRTTEFSRVVYDQYKLYIELRVPINLQHYMEDNKDTLVRYANDIFVDDENWYLSGISRIGVLPITTEEFDFDNKTLVIESDSTYSNFIKFIVGKQELTLLQRKYLFETATNGMQSNLLSATVMLGVSAELLLFDFCMAFNDYLVNYGAPGEQQNFYKRTINARNAHERLDEFQKIAEQKPNLFAKLGFEDVGHNFLFLDIIRKTRNDSGHPTGNTITDEQFRIILANYQGFLDRTLLAINQLPQMGYIQ